MRERAYAYFCLRDDDLPLDEITSRMGIAPTESWRKGDTGRYNPSLPDAGWCLYSPLPRSELSFQRHIEALLPLLEVRSSAVIDFGRRFRSWLECVGYYNQTSPGFFLRADVVRRIATLGLAVNLDLYFGEF